MLLSHHLVLFSRQPKTESWSKQRERKEKKEKRREYKDRKRKREQEMDEDDLEDLAKDARLVKKLKKGKVSYPKCLDMSMFFNGSVLMVGWDN